MLQSKSDQPVVFVVDDDEFFRKALLRLCRIEGLRAESFASAEAYLEACDRDAPGCLLLDVKMPGMDGLELQAALAAYHITLPVIFMTGAADVNMVIQGMKAGAIDFIEKPFESASLLTLVRAAIERDARQRQVTAQHAGATQKLALLTGREREILDHVVQGKPSKVIARELGISHRTVEIHRSRILATTNASSLAELIRMADKAGE